MDDIVLRFSPESLDLLNWCIAFIMFGVALDIDVQMLLRTWRQPKSLLVVVFSQIILLPLFTLLLILLLKPTPGLAMGMLMVACCPGGNVSNFFCQLAGGNTELSISATTSSSILSAISTPLIFGAISGLIVAQGSSEFDIPLFDMVKTIAWIIIIPTALGVWIQRYLKRFKKASQLIFRYTSFFILIAFIAIALRNNFDHFLNHLGEVFLLVFLMNLLAFTLGLVIGKITKMKKPDQVATSMELGIQNSGLGLVLIFNFFDANGPMSFVAAWWGIWHILAGFAFAMVYKRYLKSKSAA